jgi:hypothetical protein
MRKYRYLAVAAAGIMVLAAPAGVAFASSHSSKPVLTVGKVGGKAVKNGATLTASLASKQDVNLKIGSFSATCTKSSFTAKVIKNPASKGKATLSITKESVTGCSLTGVSGVDLKSLSALHLPYNGVITSKNALTISETSTSAPLGFSADITVDGGSLTCVFITKSSSGKTANKGNTVSFTKQSFALDKGASSALCADAGATTASYSAVFGPVKDSSAKNGKVFVG